MFRVGFPKAHQSLSVLASFNAPSATSQILSSMADASSKIIGNFLTSHLQKQKRSVERNIENLSFDALFIYRTEYNGKSKLCNSKNALFFRTFFLDFYRPRYRAFSFVR